MRVHLDLTSRQKTSFKFSQVNMQRHLTLLRKLMLPSCQGECSVFEDVEVLFSFNCSGESSDTQLPMFSVTHYVVSFSSERWKYKLETAKARAPDCVTVYIAFLYNENVTYCCLLHS